MSTANVGNETGILPKGTIVYKKCRSAEAVNGSKGLYDPMARNHVIVELIVLEDGVVPKDARGKFNPDSCSQSRKCRVPKAYVVRIIDPKDPHVKTRRRIAYAIRGSWGRPGSQKFKYEIGKVVVPDRYDGSQNQTCTNGIHVYRTLAEAINHR